MKQRARGRRRGMLKPTTIAIYASLFVLVIAIVATGYRSPESASAVTTANAAANVNYIGGAGASYADQPSVDQIQATDIAANLAASVNLPVADNVANLSIALQGASAVSQESDGSVITKPDIVQPSADNRSVQKYTVQNGDTVQSVADKFGLTTNTIKWANSLASTNSKLATGQVLTILPVNGVLYTVKSGDTIQSVATKYQVDATELTTYNDLELSGLVSGSQIIIPNGVMPTVSSSGSGGGISSRIYIGAAGNRYAYGNCTWYAYNRRAQLGLPVGSFWGDARNWWYAAELNGYQVDHTPLHVGDIADWTAYRGGSGSAGHVAIVEGIYSDGSITISEMNNYAYGGWGVVDTRAGQHIYPGDSNWPTYFIH